MAVDPNLVADRFMEIGHDVGKPLTHIDVQKLLFFFEGWHLAMIGKPAFEADFQAWKNGPVIPAIYARLKRYSAGPIPRSEIRVRGAAELGTMLNDLTERVFDTYLEHDPRGMVGLTHLPGAPWSVVRSQHGVLKGQNSEFPIPKSLMAEWFRSVWTAALESATEEV